MMRSLPTGPRPPRHGGRPASACVAAAIGAALAGALALHAVPACAQESGFATIPGGTVRLVAGPRTAEGVDAGLEIRLAPGWKTYWRYPGDSGVPPALDWSASQNVAAVTLEWPAPRRFSDGAGGFAIGYKGTVLFPLRVRLADPTRPARLKLTLDLALCESMCMPADVTLTEELAGSDDPAAAQAITAARAMVPVSRPLGGSDTPAVRAIRLNTDATPPQLEIEARVAHPDADLFVEGPNDRWALPLPQKLAAAGGGAVRFQLALEGVPPGARTEGAALRLTLVDGARAITVAAPIPAPQTAQNAAAASR